MLLAIMLIFVCVFYLKNIVMPIIVLLELSKDHLLD